jgi:diacylglycerol O-acyltransferase / wax synthase
MAKRERMSSVDTAWLRMDTPTNLMMIVGVMMFSSPLEFARLQRTLEFRLLHYRRFRQRVVHDASGAWWELDENFDIDSHVLRVSLPGKGGKSELETYVAGQISQSLDRGKPLWQFQLVENYQGGAALVARFHHCIADGIALMGVLHSLTDASRDAPEEGAAAPWADDDAKEGDEDDFWQRIIAPMGDTLVKAIRLSGKAGVTSLHLLANPERVFDYARFAAAIAGELAVLATMPEDSPTRFKGKTGVAKRVAWSEPMPLGEIKAIGKVLDCSVNDILLSCVAGALRQYLVDKGDEIEGVEVRAFVPVNLRAPGDEHRLGNRFGLVALVLPVGIEHPFMRLYEVRRRMLELKGSYQALVALGILGVVGMCPQPVQQQVLSMLSDKGTAVMTNVPGPRRPLYLAGAKLSQQMVWVPQSGNVGMGVSILSYNDGVQFGLMTDKKFVPDPHTIVNRFAPEFEKLVLTLLLDPPEPENPGPTAAAVVGKKRRSRRMQSAT